MSRQIRSAESNGCRWIHLFLWVFALSFAFDFRGESGGSVVQMGFLGIALAAGGIVVALGYRYLNVRPGAWLIVTWWSFLIFSLIVSLLSGVAMGHYARVIIPFVLCGLGIAVAHIGACSGLAMTQIVTPILISLVINVVWRAVYGFAFLGATLETVRVEILSPGINWLTAFIACAVLFRKGIGLRALLIGGLVFTILFVSVTRGPLLAMAVAGLTGFGCLVLAVLWRLIPLAWAGRKVITLSVFGAFLLALGAVVVVSQPEIHERWVDRLFNQAGGVTSKDVSWLTREAEAKAMIDILKEAPTTFVYGQGVGADYYWDPAYYPELYLVYPADFDFSGSLWFAGHSVWTYALFSGGVLGLLFHVALFGGVMVFCLRSVYVNRMLPGFRLDYAFLPFVATWCLLSESATSNPFDERLAGLVFGMMAGLPQVLFLRARMASMSRCKSVPRRGPRNPLVSGSVRPSPI
ncbi:MAG: hypothetical protein AAGD22_03300 [Verrucomicrobiota bacterium]